MNDTLGRDRIGYLIEVQHLEKHYALRGRVFVSRPRLRAVDDVSFAVRQGEVFGILGESGCGKTTTARMILRLVKPTKGSILLDGREIASLSTTDLRRQVQIIFQDPTESLNPALKVREIVGEALRRTDESRADWPARIHQILRDVGLGADLAAKFPRELSGGQRQRVGIARALALRPRLIVADEPVSALDVSVQAQILNLFLDLKQKFSLTYIFISHDVNVLRYVCDRVAVMYLGRIVESGPVDEVLNRPKHPYTVALLGAAPRLRHGRIAFASLARGELPSGYAIPRGCRYHTRCPRAETICKEVEPQLQARAASSLVACYFPFDSRDSDAQILVEPFG